MGNICCKEQKEISQKKRGSRTINTKTINTLGTRTQIEWYDEERMVLSHRRTGSPQEQPSQNQASLLSRSNQDYGQNNITIQQTIQQQGQTIQQEGQIIQQDGQVIQQERQIIQQEVPITQQEVQVIQHEGQVIQQEGSIIQREGQVIQQQGHFIPQEESIIHQEGHIIQQEGQIIFEDFNKYESEVVLRYKVCINPQIEISKLEKLYMRNQNEIKKKLENISFQQNKFKHSYDLDKIATDFINNYYKQFIKRPELEWKDSDKILIQMAIFEHDSIMRCQFFDKMNKKYFNTYECLDDQEFGNSQRLYNQQLKKYNLLQKFFCQCSFKNKYKIIFEEGFDERINTLFLNKKQIITDIEIIPPLIQLLEIAIVIHAHGLYYSQYYIENIGFLIQDDQYILKLRKIFLLKSDRKQYIPTGMHDINYDQITSNNIFFYEIDSIFSLFNQFINIQQIKNTKIYHQLKEEILENQQYQRYGINSQQLTQIIKSIVPEQFLNNQLLDVAKDLKQILENKQNILSQNNVNIQDVYEQYSFKLQDVYTKNEIHYSFQNAYLINQLFIWIKNNQTFNEIFLDDFFKNENFINDDFTLNLVLSSVIFHFISNNKQEDFIHKFLIGLYKMFTSKQQMYKLSFVFSYLAYFYLKQQQFEQLRNLLNILGEDIANQTDKYSLYMKQQLILYRFLLYLYTEKREIKLLSKVIQDFRETVIQDNSEDRTCDEFVPNNTLFFFIPNQKIELLMNLIDLNYKKCIKILNKIQETKQKAINELGFLCQVNKFDLFLISCLVLIEINYGLNDKILQIQTIIYFRKLKKILSQTKPQLASLLCQFEYFATNRDFFQISKLQQITEVNFDFLKQNTTKSEIDKWQKKLFPDYYDQIILALRFKQYVFKSRIQFLGQSQLAEQNSEIYLKSLLPKVNLSRLVKLILQYIFQILEENITQKCVEVNFFINNIIKFSFFHIQQPQLEIINPNSFAIQKLKQSFKEQRFDNFQGSDEFILDFIENFYEYFKMNLCLKQQKNKKYKIIYSQFEFYSVFFTQYFDKQTRRFFNTYQFLNSEDYENAVKLCNQLEQFELIKKSFCKIYIQNAQNNIIFEDNFDFNIDVLYSDQIIEFDLFRILNQLLEIQIILDEHHLFYNKFNKNNVGLKYQDGKVIVILRTLFILQQNPKNYVVRNQSTNEYQNLTRKLIFYYEICDIFELLSSINIKSQNQEVMYLKQIKKMIFEQPQFKKEGMDQNQLITIFEEIIPKKILEHYQLLNYFRLDSFEKIQKTIYSQNYTQQTQKYLSFFYKNVHYTATDNQIKYIFEYSPILNQLFIWLLNVNENNRFKSQLKKLYTLINQDSQKNQYYILFSYIIYYFVINKQQLSYIKKIMNGLLNQIIQQKFSKSILNYILNTLTYLYLLNNNETGLKSCLLKIQKYINNNHNNQLLHKTQVRTFKQKRPKIWYCLSQSFRRSFQKIIKKPTKQYLIDYPFLKKIVPRQFLQPSFKFQNRQVKDQKAHQITLNYLKYYVHLYKYLRYYSNNQHVNMQNELNMILKIKQDLIIDQSTQHKCEQTFFLLKLNYIEMLIEMMQGNYGSCIQLQVIQFSMWLDENEEMTYIQYKKLGIKQQDFQLRYFNLICFQLCEINQEKFIFLSLKQNLCSQVYVKLYELQNKCPKYASLLFQMKLLSNCKEDYHLIEMILSYSNINENHQNCFYFQNYIQKINECPIQQLIEEIKQEQIKSIHLKFNNIKYILIKINLIQQLASSEFSLYEDKIRDSDQFQRNLQEKKYQKQEIYKYLLDLLSFDFSPFLEISEFNKVQNIFEHFNLFSNSDLRRYQLKLFRPYNGTDWQSRSFDQKEIFDFIKKLNSFFWNCNNLKFNKKQDVNNKDFIIEEELKTKIEQRKKKRRCYPLNSHFNDKYNEVSDQLKIGIIKQNFNLIKDSIFNLLVIDKQTNQTYYVCNFYSTQEFERVVKECQYLNSENNEKFNYTAQILYIDKPTQTIYFDGPCFTLENLIMFYKSKQCFYIPNLKQILFNIVEIIIYFYDENQLLSVLDFFNFGFYKTKSHRNKYFLKYINCALILNQNIGLTKNNKLLYSKQFKKDIVINQIQDILLMFYKELFQYNKEKPGEFSSKKTIVEQFIDCLKIYSYDYELIDFIELILSERNVTWKEISANSLFKQFFQSQDRFITVSLNEYDFLQQYIKQSKFYGVAIHNFKIINDTYRILNIAGLDFQENGIESDYQSFMNKFDQDCSIEEILNQYYRLELHLYYKLSHEIVCFLFLVNNFKSQDIKKPYLEKLLQYLIYFQKHFDPRNIGYIRDENCIIYIMDKFELHNLLEQYLKQQFKINFLKKTPKESNEFNYTCLQLYLMQKKQYHTINKKVREKYLKNYYKYIYSIAHSKKQYKYDKFNQFQYFVQLNYPLQLISHKDQICVQLEEEKKFQLSRISNNLQSNQQIIDVSKLINRTQQYFHLDHLKDFLYQISKILQQITKHMSFIQYKDQILQLQKAKNLLKLIFTQEKEQYSFNSYQNLFNHLAKNTANIIIQNLTDEQIDDIYELSLINSYQPKQNYNFKEAIQNINEDIFPKIKLGSSQVGFLHLYNYNGQINKKDEQEENVNFELNNLNNIKSKQQNQAFSYIKRQQMCEQDTLTEDFDQTNTYQVGIYQNFEEDEQEEEKINNERNNNQANNYQRGIHRNMEEDEQEEEKTNSERNNFNQINNNQQIQRQSLMNKSQFQTYTIKDYQDFFKKNSHKIGTHQDTEKYQKLNSNENQTIDIFLNQQNFNLTISANTEQANFKFKQNQLDTQIIIKKKINKTYLQETNSSKKFNTQQILKSNKNTSKNTYDKNTEKSFYTQINDYKKISQKKKSNNVQDIIRYCNERNYLQQQNKNLLFMRHLGKGSYATVNLYYDTQNKKKIAIKSYYNCKYNRYMQEKQIYNILWQDEQIKTYICENILTDDKNKQLHFETGFSSLNRLKKIFNKKLEFSPLFLKHLLFSMLSFIVALKNKNYFHGDITPNNIIIQKNMILKQEQYILFKVIDFDSFSSNNDKYYIYQTEGFKNKQFVDKISWDQIFFCEIYSVCKTIEHLLNEQQKEIVKQYSKEQFDLQNQSQSQDDLYLLNKIFYFIYIFINEKKHYQKYQSVGIQINELEQLIQNIFGQKLFERNESFAFKQFNIIDEWEKKQNKNFDFENIKNSESLQDRYQVAQSYWSRYKENSINSYFAKKDSDEEKELKILDFINMVEIILFYFDLNEDDLEYIQSTVLQEYLGLSRKTIVQYAQINCIFYIYNNSWFYDNLKNIIEVLEDNIYEYDDSFEINDESIFYIIIQYIKNDPQNLNLEQMNNLIDELKNYEQIKGDWLFVEYLLAFIVQDFKQDEINSFKCCYKLHEMYKHEHENFSLFNLKNIKRICLIYCYLGQNGKVEDKYFQFYQTYKQLCDQITIDRIVIDLECVLFNMRALQLQSIYEFDEIKTDNSISDKMNSNKQIDKILNERLEKEKNKIKKKLGLNKIQS